MKIIISEEQMISLKLRRRGVDLEKISNIIENQTEMQDPCNFENAEEYADFCIGQGLTFYYNDEEDDDYPYPTEEMVEVRDEVEEYLYNKFYDYLVDIYNDLETDCER